MFIQESEMYNGNSSVYHVLKHFHHLEFNLRCDKISGRNFFLIFSSYKHTLISLCHHV